MMCNDYHQKIKTLEKIVDGEKLCDVDYMTIAHIISDERKMNPLCVFAESVEEQPRTEKDSFDFETVTAAELADEPIQGLDAEDAKKLADRLRDCQSYVTSDGDWKYDRVPSDLVQDILFFLRDIESRMG